MQDLKLLQVVVVYGVYVHVLYLRDQFRIQLILVYQNCQAAPDQLVFGAEEGQ